MSSLRPHRFPPLLQVRQGVAAPVHGMDGAQLQAALAQGFQEGLDKGYAEGRAQGLASGQDEVRRQAEREGRQQGQVQARQETLAALSGPLAAVERLASEWEQLQAEFRAAMRRDVVDLVERVARQVIRAELTLRPAQLLSLVDETLAGMPTVDRRAVVAFLNPEDLKRLTDLAPERLKGWTLHADAHLGEGECRVVANGHEADAGCSQRLEACMEQVRAQVYEDADASVVGSPDTTDVADAPVAVAGSAA